MEYEMGYLGKSTIEFVEDLPKVKRIHMIDFRYKIPEPLFSILQAKSIESGYHMNDICTLALEAFFSRKNKK